MALSLNELVAKYKAGTFTDADLEGSEYSIDDVMKAAAEQKRVVRKLASNSVNETNRAHARRPNEEITHLLGDLRQVIDDMQ
jgi:hypothetical protein